MEERIIEDEFSRGIKLRKTKDGYVDVTDELADGADEAQEDGEVVEELHFNMSTFSLEDRELAMLTPEEAEALKQRREEEALQRQAEYERLCADGEEFLAAGSFHAAELKFKKALSLHDEPTQATVGYWRAKTEEFTNPDVFAETYAYTKMEDLEFDLGYKALDEIRERYQGVFRQRVAELSEEEKPLAEELEVKQESRRSILKERLTRSSIWTAVAAVPAIVCLILTIVFALKIATVRENTYIVPTIVCAAGFLASLIAFVFVANKLINVWRMHRANERLYSSEGGQRLMDIRNYKKLYEALLP